MSITITVKDGADLVTRLSADEAGPANFQVNRDWRRDIDQLTRREGDEYFAPKDGGSELQPYPADPEVGEPVTVRLQFTARRDNGQTAYVCGTKTRLFRFVAFDDARVLADDVVEDGVLAPIGNGAWLCIGAGFSEAGHRWEALNCGGYAVFNNGVDLPVSYRLDEWAVQPIHELREQGVASVGTIVEIEGVLVLFDISEIHEDRLAGVMTATGYGRYTEAEHIDRVRYLALWGDPVGPRRWGATVPGAIEEGSRRLQLEYAVASLRAGDRIRVVGAGAYGADLITTLLFFVSESVAILADVAATTVTGAAVGKADAASLMVGKYPLLDDSTGVLRAVKHKSVLVIAKESGFVIGQLTGNRAAPFTFKQVYTGKLGLRWRWTLIEAGGDHLLYAGEQAFYTFDLVTRTPALHPKLSLCDNLFFGPVAGASEDEVFAADNALTSEVWICYPNEGPDKALAVEYQPNGRVTTLGEAYSSAATIEQPATGESVFVLGLPSGAVVRYLMDRTGPLGWRRRGADYVSEVLPALADFGDPANEKHVSQYTILPGSQSPANQVTVSFLGVRNACEAPVELPGSPKQVTLATRNTCYVHYLVHLIQERIRATGPGNVRIGRRVWKVSRGGGAGFTRR